MNTFNADEWVETTCVRCGDAFYTRTGQTVCPRDRILNHARDTLVFEHFPRDKPGDGKFRCWPGGSLDDVIAMLEKEGEEK